MSLLPQFFFERDEKIEALRQKGYIALDDFLKEHKISKARLFKLWFIAKNKIFSTADLYDFDVTEKGRQYITTYKTYRFMVIKKNKAEELLKAISGYS